METMSVRRVRREYVSDGNRVAGRKGHRETFQPASRDLVH